jgi:hypothetical protein
MGAAFMVEANEEARQTAARIRASLLTGDWSWFPLETTLSEKTIILSGLCRWVLSVKPEVSIHRIEVLKSIFAVSAVDEDNDVLRAWEFLAKRLAYRIVAVSWDEAQADLSLYLQLGALAFQGDPHYISSYLLPLEDRFIPGPCITVQDSNFNRRLRQRKVDIEDGVVEALAERKAGTAPFAAPGWTWFTAHGGTVGQSYDYSAEAETLLVVIDPDEVAVAFLGRCNAKYNTTTVLALDSGIRGTGNLARKWPKTCSQEDKAKANAKAVLYLILAHRLVRMRAASKKVLA